MHWFPNPIPARLLLRLTVCAFPSSTLQDSAKSESYHWFIGVCWLSALKEHPDVNEAVGLNLQKWDGALLICCRSLGKDGSQLHRLPPVSATVMFLSHTGPWSYPTCSFHWVGAKAERENPSTCFIPWGNSHPSSCHLPVTSCCFQPHVALGTWVQQDVSGQMHFQKHCKAPFICFSPRFLEESFCGNRRSIGVSLVADIPFHPSLN